MEEKIEFNLYRKRGFSELVSDSFTFFKLYFKSYMKNYIYLIGVFVVAIMALVWIMFGKYFNQLFIPEYEPIPDMGAQEIIIKMSVIFILILITYIFSVSYPFAFLKAMEEKGSGDLTFDQIYKHIKPSSAKVLSFALKWIPVLILMSPVFFIVVIPGIGYLALQIFGIVFGVFAFQALAHYILDGEKFFRSMKVSFKNLKQKFWDKVGSYFVINLITNVAAIAILLVVVILSSLCVYLASVRDLHLFVFLFFIATALFLFLSMCFSNIVVINQILIYFTSKEEKMDEDEIDLIGGEKEK